MSVQDWRKIILYVESVQGNFLVVDIPQWSSVRKHSIPLESLPYSVRAGIEPGRWLIALGNFSEADSDDLVMKDYRFAPNPDSNDGLE